MRFVDLPPTCWYHPIRPRRRRSSLRGLRATSPTSEGRMRRNLRGEPKDSESEAFDTGNSNASGTKATDKIAGNVTFQSNLLL